MGWIPTLIFADEDGLLPQSRDGKSPNRYFPELLEALAPLLEKPCVLEREMVIVGSRGVDFEALLQRIHPAVSRVGGAAPLVCEVAFDHMQGDRFRHSKQFARWRPDKSAKKSRYDQLEVTAPYELEKSSS